MKPTPTGALKVTDDIAHSGRHSLKWDLSQVADPQATGRHTRWLTVNVTLPGETVKRLRGQRVRFGYWMRLGAGTTIPGLQLRQNLKDKPGDGFRYSGGVGDPAVWNHFETEGRLSPELESMDIHTWCAIPEAELARQCYFYMNDVSLQVVEELALSISTSLDEYYVGETIAWTLKAASPSGRAKVELLLADRLLGKRIGELERGRLQSAFETSGLKPGVYTLRATVGSERQAVPPAQRQIILAPDPFDWFTSVR